MSFSVLFLDDNPERLSAFAELCAHARLVTTAEEVIENLRNQESWDYLYLDHDLGGEIFVDSERADCGMEVVRYVMANPSEIGHIVVHSYNHPASNAMVAALRAADYKVTRAMFLSDEFLSFVGAMAARPEE